MTAKRRGKPQRIIIHRAKLGPPLPPTRGPLDAVLCTLDSAKRTGWAIYIRGALVDFGEVKADPPANRWRVLVQATALAYQHKIPCGLLIEVPYGGYVSVAVSLSKTAALWRDTWLQLGQMDERCIERTAGAWRKVLFGASNMPREQSRRLEHALALQIAARAGITKPIGGDSAPAICIGQTIIRSRVLRSVLGCNVLERVQRQCTS